MTRVAGHVENLDFRRLFEAVPDSYLVIKPDAPRYTIVAVSDAYARAVLARRDELLGKGLFEILASAAQAPTAADVHDLSESLARVVSRGVIDRMTPQRSYTVHRATPAGATTERWWRPTHTPVIGHDGQLEYIIHRVEDVAERERRKQASPKRLPDERRRSDGESMDRVLVRLKESVRRSTTSIAMLDRRMNYLAVSERYLKEYCNGIPDPTGLHHYDVIPDLPDWWKEVHRNALAGATLSNEEDVWIRADGTKIWLRWCVQPWFDGSGAIGGITISAEDITARKRAEEALRASEQRYATIFERASYALAVMRMSDEVFVAVNDAFTRMYESPREVLLGQTGSMLGLLEPDSCERATAALRERGKLHGFAVVRITKLGERRELTLDVEPIEIDGQPHVTVCIRELGSG